jgi:hypothetical protein
LFVKMEVAIPGASHYACEERRWESEHRYLMGCEEGRRIPGNEAAMDFLTGNDHKLEGGQPDGRFHHHLSPRGLPWEKEFRIWYYHSFIVPAVDEGGIPESEAKWLGSKFRDIVDSGLDKLRPITEKTILRRP